MRCEVIRCPSKMNQKVGDKSIRILSGGTAFSKEILDQN